MIDHDLRPDRPTVLEMVTDPDVPPVPPHVTAEQMKDYVKALVKGDPDAVGVVIQSAKAWWDGLFPPKGGARSG